MTKSRAVNNKKTGARFEGDVRRVLKATGYFTVAKGVSTNGIDVFGIKKDNATQLELKSHKSFINSEYKEALSQLIENYKVIKDFLACTNYEESKVIYRLIYYVRNVILIIADIHGNKLEYKKTRNINLIDFLTEAFIDSKTIL